MTPTFSPNRGKQKNALSLSLSRVFTYYQFINMLRLSIPFFLFKDVSLSSLNMLSSLVCPKKNPKKFDSRAGTGHVG